MGMWPKAFAQFVELAPHISRLLPMADRFFQSKTAGDDDAHRKVVEAVQTATDGLRGDFGEVTAAHTALSKQVGDLDGKLDAAIAEVQTAKLATDAVVAETATVKLAIDSVANDIRATKFAMEAIERRMTHFETIQSRLSYLYLFVFVATLAMLVLLGLVFARVH